MYLAATLAKHFGWQEEHIVWRIPLRRALSYYHAILRSEGVWTVKPSAPVREKLAELHGFFDSGAKDEDALL